MSLRRKEIEVDDARRAQADGDLVRAVQSGSSEAFAELYRRHVPAVRRSTRSMLRNAGDSEEVAQAAFVRAFERIDQCNGDRRFGAWVQVIARRLCLDTIRARARIQPELVTRLDDQPSRGPGNPEEFVLHDEAVRHLHAALGRLPTRQRDAVVARAMEDRPPREIAASLGLSTGAVDSLLLRARRSLAKEYQRKAG